MLSEPEERIVIDARRHGIVLVRSFLHAGVLAAAGAVGLIGGWPFSAGGAGLLIVAALAATAAVWRWDRTHVVLTTRKLFVVYGVVRRRAAVVRLERIGALEIDQSLLGRMLGYGTIVAGELQITCVAKPGQMSSLLARAAAQG